MVLEGGVEESNPFAIAVELDSESCAQVDVGGVSLLIL